MHTKYAWCILGASVLFISSTSYAADPVVPDATQTQVAQRPELTLKLSRQETVKPLASRQLRVAYLREGTPVFGALQYSKEGISWLPAQAAPVKLPYALDTLVAADGRHLLQYGDSANRQHPAKTDLFFLNGQGEVQGRVVDRYGPQSNLVMAEDGHVAIAGTLFEEGKYTEIGLYTATGEKRFQVRLAEDRRANIAVPTPQGQRVAVFTTDTQDFLAHHRLEVLGSDGSKIAEQQGLGVLQKAVVVANGSLFFVQARSRFGLVNASDGSLMWSRDGVLRLVSPYGAATDPTGKILFLAAAEWDGIPKARYHWRIEMREVASGNELGSFVLPDTYPSSEGRVFLKVTGEQLELLAGDERIVLDWRLP